MTVIISKILRTVLTLFLTKKKLKFGLHYSIILIRLRMNEKNKRL